MKRIFQKSSSFAMAFLLLFSTVSFTVEKHFCGKVLVDQAVFSEAASCGMHPETSGISSEDNCCNEQKVVVEGQKDLKISFDDLDLSQQVFLTGFTVSYLELFAEEFKENTPFFQYKPPLLVYNILVRDQTFLI